MQVSYGGDRYKTFDPHNNEGAPPVETLPLMFKEIDVMHRQKCWFLMYFDKFPIIPYDSVGDLQFKDVQIFYEELDLAKPKSNTVPFDTYSVKEGETPEMIAHKLYGDSIYILS